MRVFRTVVLGVVFGMACNANADLSLEIAVPSDVVSKTAWFEVGAYKDVDCKTLDSLLDNGLPEGPTGRVAFERSAQVGPRFGDLPRGAYAFAGVARDKNCTVLARGCIEENVGDAKSVSIQMKSVKDGPGKCASGNACVAAKCVPANDNADPLVGANCTLELLGAGPLLHTASGRAVMSAPAIGTTVINRTDKDGHVAPHDVFVITYRESEPGGGSTKIVVLPVDEAGGIYGVDKRVEQPPNVFGYSCSASQTDGVGLLLAGTSGMVTFAKGCDGSTALSILNFTVAEDDPKLSTLAASVAQGSVDTSTPTAPSLGAIRSTALRQAGSLLAYTQDGVAHIANLDATKGAYNAGTNSFGGTSGITDAWIVVNDSVLALLASGTGGTTDTPTDADGGGGGPGIDPTEPSLRLLMLPPNTSIESINATTNMPRAPISIAGKWASIAAIGSRVIVLSDGKGPGRSVTYRAFDLNSDSPSDTSGFSVDGDGEVTAGDVAIQGDRAFFAALKPGEIELQAFDHASTTLQPLSSVTFSREPRISAINTIGEGHVAIATSNSRVAVVWTTQGILDENDPAGGYAVFACTP